MFLFIKAKRFMLYIVFYEHWKYTNYISFDGRLRTAIFLIKYTLYLVNSFRVICKDSFEKAGENSGNLPL